MRSDISRRSSLPIDFRPRRFSATARLPWFRVVAAGGVVSTIKLGAVGRRQVERLRAEGVAVTPRNKVEDFDAVAWFPG